MDGQTFVTHLRRSGLIPDDDLDRLLSRFPRGDGGRDVARGLIDLGVITRFQAERLLAGRSGGFILGQYRILDEVGRGGMGRVFKAEHRTMGRLVAIKILAPEVLKSDRTKDIFFREVRALSQLVHPNIVAAYDANATSNRYYLVLEYVDGPNLDQLVRAEGPLAVARACEYVRQVALGLQCAHKQDMVHRDIKPANLLVQQRGVDGDSPGLVKISDFGLARLNHPDAPPEVHRYSTIYAAENTVMGTPDYLAPEQSRSLHEADIRSDLYGLGCSFYYLLTGHVPFPGGTPITKLIRHNTIPAPLVSVMRPDVPQAVEDIVSKLLAKSPDHRYQTPAELAEVLAPFSAPAPILWAPPISPSAECDTLPLSRAKTIDERPEFDFTSDDLEAPRAPSRSNDWKKDLARWRSREMEWLQSIVSTVRGWFGK